MKLALWGGGEDREGVKREPHKSGIAFSGIFKMKVKHENAKICLL